MSKISWETKLGIILVGMSIIVYAVKFSMLGDAENTYFYIFNALGFLPINVLLVTIVLNKLLAIRSRRDKLEKLNMVIGTFFSEVGTNLLSILSHRDPDVGGVRKGIVVRKDWTEEDFAREKTRLKEFSFSVNIRSEELAEIRTFLTERRNFLLRLLENPVLLEHESFTEVLRAVFHLTEELERRGDLNTLPDTDLDHLAGDTNRVYGLLVLQWMDYMLYLKTSYPYLFSLAIRTNPFDMSASPVVTS